MGGSLRHGRVDVFQAPGGRGPYGIDTAPDGSVYYASLAGSHIARIDLESGAATPIARPQQGRAPAVSGRTRAAASGSASGTPARWRCTTRERRMEGMAAAGAEGAAVRRVRRRARPGVAERLCGECAGALQPRDGAVRHLSVAQPNGQRAAAPGEAWRGLGRGVGRGQAGGGEVLAGGRKTKDEATTPPLARLVERKCRIRYIPRLGLTLPVWHNKCVETHCQTHSVFDRLGVPAWRSKSHAGALWP